jgi:hypothetical protein
MFFSQAVVGRCYNLPRPTFLEDLCIHIQVVGCHGGLARFSALREDLGGPSSRPTPRRRTPIATTGLPFSVHVGPEGAASRTRVFDGT